MLSYTSLQCCGRRLARMIWIWRWQNTQPGSDASVSKRGRLMIKCEFENGKKASLRHVCADVLVLKDDKILLQLRSTKLLMEPGKWALAGGFVDLDETVAEAAEREVL